MGEAEEFNTLAFEKKLMQLKDTQESIQSLSSWCLKQRAHHKKIVASWLNVLKRVKVEQRLVLFYLANDVIQYSKRKSYEFVDSWGLNLQKATPLVRDEKVRPKILRIFKIWEQRSVYDEEFLSDLTGLLSAGATKKSDEDPLDFQPQQLINKIKQCVVLEGDTDLRLKYIHENHLQLSDAEALCASLKERSLKDDVEKELNEGIGCMERYTQALQREIVAREALLALLNTGSQYYLTQMSEVKVVAYAYKTFGTRVRTLKRKLDDMVLNLPNAAPSPPQRDEDVPSPGPDEDLDLPVPESADDDDLSYNIDQTFNSTLGADGSLYNMGLSSFLTSENPMAMFNDSMENINNSNKIEVINSRPNEKQDSHFNINDFFKKMVTTENNNTVIDSTKVVSGPLTQKSQDTLPGLDLLTPESTGNPAPPTSFYGTMNNIIDLDPPYHTETNTPWSNNTWNADQSVTQTPVQVGLGSVFSEPPESPPRLSLPTPAPKTPTFPQEMPPVSDVDHRGLLPPPPPPPVMPMMGNLEDVDHRMLAAPSPPIVSGASRHSAMHQDVDHRNLIPLTQEPQVIGPRSMSAITLDQDYRVPPLVMPTDIVESVDMDLSEDEEQQAMYQSQQQKQSEHPRRHSFNNNKVLVGGDNGKTNHMEHNHTNLIQINKTTDKEPPHSAPLLPPMVNPFEVIPPMKLSPPVMTANPPVVPVNPPIRPLNPPIRPLNPPPMMNVNAPFLSAYKDFDDDNSKDDVFDSEQMDNIHPMDNIHLMDNIQTMDNVHPVDSMQLSPPGFKSFANNSEWRNEQPRQFMNQRFPRNWGPRTNFRPQGFGPQQFWPRSAPRPPNRWPGPRPQRFW